MCNKIKLLDCTLRDGAYITNSIFGDNVIKGIINNLYKANVEMIEVGWLKDSEHKVGSSYYHLADDIVKYLPENKTNDVDFVVMMDYGRYDINNLSNYNGKSINSVRLVFPKEKFEEAIDFSQIIKDKGYNLCLQAANTQSYGDLELIQLAQKINQVMPKSISIVDTFGTMYPNDLGRIFMILNNNLDKNIKLGFHSHNNLQLSFALSIEFIKLSMITKREIIIDSSLCGMGRGAGNTCTELITNYLNIHNDANYDINIIMDTIDIYMQNFILNYQWGYNISYCIAGQLGSHVNNIAYLQNTHKIGYRALKSTLESLPRNQRKLYDYDVLENAYVDFINKEIDDTSSLEKLKKLIKDKDILLIAPGKTIENQKNDINDFIQSKNPVVIGINSINKNYNYDLLFFSNEMRYKYAKNQDSMTFNKILKILTSNVKTNQTANESIINYNTLMKRGWKYFDNSTIMAIRLMIKLEAKSVNLAGLDGYNIENQNSYSDVILQTNLVKEEKMQLNKDLNEMLKDIIDKYQSKINLHFITNSRFDYLEKGNLIHV